ncbi:MAG: hypothetical protein Kow0060_14170 [Methylohalobius crimeensis]
MPDRYRYTALICTLPAHSSLAEIRQTPLSRIRLWQRLRSMEPADYQCLTRAVRLLEWYRHPMQETDSEFINRIDREIHHINCRFLQDLVIWRLELRSLVAALRYKMHGLKNPPTSPWGYGRWLATICRNWNRDYFGLEKAHPWLKQGTRFLREGDTYGFEKLLLLVVWNHLDRIAGDHYFDFEAVIVYVQRWDVIDRWTRYHSTKALDRFDHLASAGLASINETMHQGHQQTFPK